MTDYQIYKKLRPFLLRRLVYALLGLLVILGVLALATYWGLKFPDYREAIIALCAVLGIFIGWKIIRKGESRYRMAQVSVIVDIVQGTDSSQISSTSAINRVKKTFKYATFFGLVKNIFRHKNFRKTGQFFTVMIANMLPYVGTCSIAWIFAHPEEDKIKGACHAISNYYEHRKALRGKLLKAFLKEIGLVVIAFFVFFALEWVIYAVALDNLAEIDPLLDKVESFTDTIELVYDWYFEQNKGYTWSPIDVMTIIALYLAWFFKVFSIRAYQMIAIIRDYLAIGETDPPSDKLYNKFMTEWEKTQAKKPNKSAATVHKPDIATDDDERTKMIDANIDEIRKEILEDDDVTDGAESEVHLKEDN